MSKKTGVIVATITVALVLWLLLPVHRVVNTEPSSQILWNGDGRLTATAMEEHRSEKYPRALELMIEACLRMSTKHSSDARPSRFGESPSDAGVHFEGRDV